MIRRISEQLNASSSSLRRLLLSSTSNNTWTIQEEQKQDQQPKPPPEIQEKLIDASDERIVRQYFMEHDDKINKDCFEVDAIVGTGTFGIVRIAHLDLSQPPSKKLPPDTKNHVHHESNSTTHSKSCLKVAIKQLSKKSILAYNQLPHIENEKKILYQIRNEFIISLYTHFQDDRFCYLILEYAIGGELFGILRQHKYLSISAAKFYSAEIYLAISYLHERNIIYRDLKPENVLIAKDGHIKLTDFGFAKQTITNSYTLCGTPEYLAPEIIVNSGHHKACDWWAFGVLLYEMVAGFPPFFSADDDVFAVYKKILRGEFEFDMNGGSKIRKPKFENDRNVKQFVSGLLTVEIPQRLGCGLQGDQEIKYHAFYEEMDWVKVADKKVTPPIIPYAEEEGVNETKCFDDYDSEQVEEEIFALDRVDGDECDALTAEEQLQFASW